MQLSQALRLKGDVAAAEALTERVRKLNQLYNQIVRVRSPRRENQVSDLAELGKACEDAGLVDEARGWYAWRSPSIPSTARRSRHCIAWADRDVDRPRDRSRDAGGSRTHLNRVAAGRLAVWLQRRQ